MKSSKIKFEFEIGEIGWTGLGNYDKALESIETFFCKAFAGKKSLSKTKEEFNKYYNNLIKIASKKNKKILISNKNKWLSTYLSHLCFLVTFFPEGKNNPSESRVVRKCKLDSINFYNRIFMNLPFWVTEYSPEKLESMLEKAEKFSGRVVTLDNEMRYREIDQLQSELIEKHGPRSQFASLTSAVTNYSKKHRLLYSESKIKSTAEAVRRYQKTYR